MSSEDWLDELLQADPTSSLGDPHKLGDPDELTQWLEDANNQLCSVQMKAATSPKHTPEDQHAQAQFRTQITVLALGIDASRCHKPSSCSSVMCA